MKIRSLQLIQAILSEGSLTGAAHVLNISQPTASKLLGDLEDSISAALFNRVRGRLVPTREARLLGSEIAGLIEAMTAFEVKAQALGLGDQREIELHVCPEILEAQFVPALARFWTENPEVALSVHPAPDNRRAILELLAAAPQALVITQVSPPFSGQSHRRIGQMRYRLVVPKGHEGAPWTLPQILPPQGTTRRRIVTEYCATFGLDLKSAITAPTLNTQMSYVMAGLGAAFLPGGPLPAGLVALTPAQLPAEPIWLVGQTRKLSLALRRLIEPLQHQS